MSTPARSRIVASALAVLASVMSADARADDPASPVEETEWNSPALATTGFSISGVGLLVATTGSVLMATSCGGDGEGLEPAVQADDRRCERGFRVALVGGPMILAGIPLIVAGVWSVPGGGGSAARLLVGPTRARVAVSF